MKKPFRRFQKYQRRRRLSVGSYPGPIEAADVAPLPSPREAPARPETRPIVEKVTESV